MSLLARPLLTCLGLRQHPHLDAPWLYPGEIIDLLKGLLIAICVLVFSYIDTSMMYHLIKSQSVIKLYIIFNMLEVGDRLFSAFGQDTIDSLFWTGLAANSISFNLPSVKSQWPLIDENVVRFRWIVFELTYRSVLSNWEFLQRSAAVSKRALL